MRLKYISPVHSSALRMLASVMLYLFPTVTFSSAQNVQTPSSGPEECISSVRAIETVRRRIEDFRKITTVGEANCAFAEYMSGSLGRECTEIKAAATADPVKARAWGQSAHAWDALNRMRLRLRQLEDRLGIECDSQ